MAKILVVEDDLGLARMVSDWLKFEHHMVETANNGRDCIKRLRKKNRHRRREFSDSHHP